MFISLAKDRSARRFSSVPRSVFPPSSCDKRPESRNSDSILPSRFSNPSMYFALDRSRASAPSEQSQPSVRLDVPFWRIAFLFNLGEYTIGLVVDTMRALGHFAIAFDLLLPTHIAGLRQPNFSYVSFPSMSKSQFRRKKREPSHPRDSPSFSIILIVSYSHCWLILKSLTREYRGYWRTILSVGTEKLRLLIHQHGHVEAHSV